MTAPLLAAGTVACPVCQGWALGPTGAPCQHCQGTGRTPCEGCTPSAVPGAIWPRETGCAVPPQGWTWAERCDTCRYPEWTDAQAAAAVAAHLAATGTPTRWAYLACPAEPGHQHAAVQTPTTTGENQ